MEVIVEILVGALKLQDKTLKVSVAIWHQLDGFLFGLGARVLLYGHTRRKNEFRWLNLDIMFFFDRVKYVAFYFISALAADVVLYCLFPSPKNTKILKHAHVSLLAHLRHLAGYKIHLRLGEPREFDSGHLDWKVLERFNETLLVAELVARGDVIGTVGTVTGLGLRLAAEKFFDFNAF